MTLIASDGYEYADLTQRLLGRPLENTRNKQVVSFRFRRTEEGFIKAWCEGYDYPEVGTPESKRWKNAADAAAYVYAHGRARASLSR